MAELYANSPVAGSSTPVSLALLTEALTAGQATIKVSAAAPAALQGGEFRIVIDHEIILVTAEQNTLTWTVTRGVENTAAEAHAAGTGVFHYLTAGALAKIIREGAEAVVPTVTALPAEPKEGQQVDFQSATMAEAGVRWRLKYNGKSASTHKWEFVGGASLFSAVETEQGTKSEVSTDLATVGPQVTVPLAGDYDVGLHILAKGISATTAGALAIANVGVGQPEAFVQLYESPHEGQDQSFARRSFVAGEVVSTKYRAVGIGGLGEIRFAWRRLVVTPVRVG